MAANITSAEFTDDTRLFYSRQSANTWRLGLRCPSAGTSSEGAVKQCTHVADMTSIDGTSVDAGSAAADQLTMGTLNFTSDADVKTAFIALAEKINYLTYRLEQAGVMASS